MHSINGECIWFATSRTGQIAETDIIIINPRPLNVDSSE